MIETLMKQLYFRGLRRRVEHLVAQRREASPSEVYLYWIDGGDGNDPWMAIGPNGEEWYRGDPGPIPGIDTSARRSSSSANNPIPGIEDAAGREASSPTNPTPQTAIMESGSPASARSRRNVHERGRRIPCEHGKPLGARAKVARRASSLHYTKAGAAPEVSRPAPLVKMLSELPYSVSLL